LAKSANKSAPGMIRTCDQRFRKLAKAQKV
jgi:hypothetical protein